MKTYVFVAEDGEAAQTLVRQAAERGIEIQAVVGDGGDSTHLREIYDITTRPAVLVTQEDGTYVRLWQGIIPSVGEVAHAAQGRL